MRTFHSFLSLAILSLCSLAAIAADKLTVGVALPRAQLGQPNGASADVAEPVRKVFMSYLRGPLIEVVPLEARIPAQIAAEAREKGCAYVLYTDVAQVPKGGGLGMLKKLAPVAGMLPMIGGGSMGTQMAASAVAQGVMQAQAADAQQDAIENAMAAINGAQQSHVKAGDSVSLQYKLVRVGEEQPVKADKVVGKAKANGEDLLSPMIEAVAVAVVDAVSNN
ncbi:MAG TPA: hypothetical protein VFL16_05360 [Steroidobacteraceae bacterium]|jgi:hypothetical protein|nr:hypothetical protein [Steroidobacteraceae bacterium]